MPREIRWEMIPTGMKCVQTVMSGRNFRMNFTSGMRAQPVEPQPQLVGLPRLVALLVNPPEHLRRGADQLDVELRVKIPEQLVRVDQRVLVLHRLHPGVLAKVLASASAAFTCPVPALAEKISTRFFVMAWIGLKRPGTSCTRKRPAQNSFPIQIALSLSLRRMLDIRLIREKPDFVKEPPRHARRRLPARSSTPSWSAIPCAAPSKPASSSSTPTASGSPRRSACNAARARTLPTSRPRCARIGDEIAQLNQETAEAEARQRDLLLQMPNLPHPAAPIGARCRRRTQSSAPGAKSRAFRPRAATSRSARSSGLFDLERAARMSGSAFVCYTGQGARLQRALINFMLDLHTREHGYTEISPPFVVTREALIGTTPIAEIRGAALPVRARRTLPRPHRRGAGHQLPPRGNPARSPSLPKHYVAYTPCFRREAGRAGLGTRGLIRVHQFDKVELVKTHHAGDLLRGARIPHRRMPRKSSNSSASITASSSFAPATSASAARKPTTSRSGRPARTPISRSRAARISRISRPAG